MIIPPVITAWQCFQTKLLTRLSSLQLGLFDLCWVILFALVLISFLVCESNAWLLQAKSITSIPPSSFTPYLPLSTPSSSSPSHGCLPHSPSEWQWYWCKMCRLWAAEAYNPCMPGPATATVYGFIVFPFMSSPVGEGGQQFRKFTVYVPMSGREIMRVLTCVCAHCTHMYPDQLVRAQPPEKINMSTCMSACVRLLLGRSRDTSPTSKTTLGDHFFPNDPGIKQVEQQLNSTFFICPSLSLLLSFPSLPLSFHSFLSFSHYQGVACDWQMGTNNNFFFRNLRPSSVIGLPADISKPHSPPAAPTTPLLILGLWMRHPEGEKSREREKNISTLGKNLREREGRRGRVGACVHVCKRHLFS